MKDPHEVFLATHDAAELRSLLGKRTGSPVANELAVLGRRPGSVVMATLRNGWPFTIRVLDAASATEKETT